MLTDGRWPEGISAHVARVTAATKQPCAWEKAYETRRLCSREERVVRQVAVESQWKDTSVERIWMNIREFASPADNFQMNRARVVLFLRHAGVASTRLREELASLFFDELLRYTPTEGACASINAMHLCKVLELCLDAESFRLVLLPHCYANVVAVVDARGEWRSRVMLEEVKNCVKRLMEDFSSRNQEERENQLRTVGRLMAVEDAMAAAECDELTLESFASLLFAPGSSYLVSTFLNHILEVCARQLRAPFGQFPVLPLQWVNSTKPVPFDLCHPRDGDALLLRQFEQRERQRTLWGSEGRKKNQARGR